MRLRSKPVLLTGCASGIGRPIRELFAEEGASIAMGDVDTGGGREILEIVKARGAQGSFVRADVSVGTDVQELVATAVASPGVSMLQ